MSIQGEAERFFASGRNGVAFKRDLSCRGPTSEQRGMCMSVQNVRTFYLRLAEDKALMAKVAKAAEELRAQSGTREGSEDRLLAETFALIEPLAKEAGCPFTLEDMESYVKSDERRLTDAEMAGISGGAVCGCVLFGAG